MSENWAERHEFTATTPSGEPITVTIGRTRDGRPAFRIGARHAVYFTRSEASKLTTKYREIIVRSVQASGW